MAWANHGARDDQALRELADATEDEVVTRLWPVFGRNAAVRDPDSLRFMYRLDEPFCVVGHLRASHLPKGADVEALAAELNNTVIPSLLRGLQNTEFQDWIVALPLGEPSVKTTPFLLRKVHGLTKCDLPPRSLAASLGGLIIVAPMAFREKVSLHNALRNWLVDQVSTVSAGTLPAFGAKVSDCGWTSQ